MQSADDNHAPTIRRTVYFTGRVQGVGFRYVTQSIALRHPVTGFVRNLPDGRVELVAEGTTAELDRLQAAVHDAMRSYVQAVDATNGVATGEFRSFNIAL